MKKPRKTIIKVTEQDIERGIRNSAYSCPIALAVKRRCRASYVSVSDCVLRHTPTKREKVANLPRGADTFITRFDQGLKVRPFSFPLYFEEVK